MPNRTGKNTTFSWKKQILALILNALGGQIKAKSEKKGRFLEEITPSLVIGWSNGIDASTPVERLRQCYALAVADIDAVRRCAVGMSSRKIVERVGLNRG